MNTCTRSLLQTIGLDGKVLSPVAGRLLRAVRPITPIGVGVCCRELASLRQCPPPEPEPEDLILRGRSKSFAELPLRAPALGLPPRSSRERPWDRSGGTPRWRPRPWAGCLEAAAQLFSCANLAACPKGLWLAGIARSWSADHLYARWRSADFRSLPRQG